VVKYLDMPLQHAHPEMLKAMRRPRDVAHVKEVLARARQLMPGIALRTTFIAGFPGETAAHFEAVLALMREVRFDHVGVFTYFPEEGTPAAELPGQVSDRVKQRRKAKALELQQGISRERNESFVGREVEVLVEGQADGKRSDPARPEAAPEGGELLGRTYRDAPEVDGFVVFRGAARPGDLVRVRVAAAGPYDLFGEQEGPGRAGSGAAPGAGQVLPLGGGRPRAGLRSLPVLQPR
jgi:ribosomal protein S12 methylthiotransferase